MLTRLEIDGFKNLLDFSVDFGPFTCIAGRNGVGKSNIFDVIQFLSLLSDNTLMDAALSVRDTEPETADLRELFWTDGRERVSSFRIAAEMIVEKENSDDFGRLAEASSTYLRYEIRIGYEESARRGILGRLVLESEDLNYITEGQASHRLKFPHNARDFRKSIVDNKRRTKTGYISTERSTEQEPEILIHQEGHQGRPQRAPAKSAPRTIVATSNTSTTPTILAARREMQRWRLLALEPSSMRQTDKFQSPSEVTSSGGHLPSTLYRLTTEETDQDGNAEQVSARVANRLSELVGVPQVEVDIDEVRQLLSLQVREKSGIVLPARSLSDGTLRFLTLCILAEDPSTRGVICMEEPENGIHPAKLDAMVELLHDLAVDPSEMTGITNPFRQVIVATHSPYFVQLQEPDDLLLATEVEVKGPTGKPTTTLRCRPLNNTWRANQERGVGELSIIDYLVQPPNARFQLPFGEDLMTPRRQNLQRD
ncbi:AAA domain [Rubrobacter radiotolerans]|uniref:AAA domain n=1 Tax=Rubrobacter radiotolerans TaxID=42256 RepID=A0A023X5C6_RUBRA|nr:AAA family ATPase [Rubrobacter radiotolerans]AHY47416.1 AAA domain [Rubrobacter radiotolerans]MDX5894819.1 AAA family ATPase [Rubrobacter radiotolerans]SMC06823.1 Predicted ATPase [Rubrobacter radiotolerans DSM 5868]